MDIFFKSKKKIPFKDIKVGECFIDNYPDILIKGRLNGNHLVLSLSDGTIYNGYIDTCLVTPIKAEVREVSDE